MSIPDHDAPYEGNRALTDREAEVARLEIELAEAREEKERCPTCGDAVIAALMRERDEARREGDEALQAMETFRSNAREQGEHKARLARERDEARNEARGWKVAYDARAAQVRSLKEALEALREVRFSSHMTDIVVAWEKADVALAALEAGKEAKRS